MKQLTDIELIKAIAQIEVVKLARCMNGTDRTMVDIPSVDGRYQKEYNPLSDSDLNCYLRDKYEVEINYKNNRACFDTPSKDPMYRSWVKFNGKPEINRAVLMAIYEANKNKLK